jgi:hypothetical protein
MNPSSKGFDGAVKCPSAVLMDALAFCSVLLVGHADGGFGCCKELRKRGVVGYQMSIVCSEGDVLDSKWDCVCFE